MKKILITFSIFMSTYYAFSQDVELTVVGPRNTTMNDHRYSVPVVNVDGDDVTIKSDSTITDMTVVIRDQYGNVMHQSTQTVGPDETTLYVPNTDGDSEKTTIDLYYDRRHLSGTFEE